MTREKAIELLESYDFPEESPDLTQAAYMGAAALREELAENTPLTLEELREMDGEPVWVVFKSEDTDACQTLPQWMLIVIEGNEIFLVNSRAECCYCAEPPDCNYIAGIYRRPPEETS